MSSWVAILHAPGRGGLSCVAPKQKLVAGSTCQPSSQGKPHTRRSCHTSAAFLPKNRIRLWLTSDIGAKRHSSHEHHYIVDNYHCKVSSYVNKFRFHYRGTSCVRSSRYLRLRHRWRLY